MKLKVEKKSLTNTKHTNTYLTNVHNLYDSQNWAFPHASCASWGLSLPSVYYKIKIYIIIKYRLLFKGRINRNTKYLVQTYQVVQLKIIMKNV